MKTITTNVGVCLLCGQTRLLVDSHIIPQGCYGRLGPKGKPLVNIVRRNAFMTQKQLKTRLLCKACEGNFNKLGERPFFLKCLQSDGTFSLLDDIMQHEAKFVGVRDDVVYCPLAETPIGWQYLPYFAASLFWRAWAARKKFPNAPISIDFPPELEAGLRAFLLGKTPSIEHGALTVNINQRLPEPADDMRYAFSLPQEQGNLPIGDQKLRVYGAECLGFVFTLSTGPEPALGYARSNCILTNPANPIFIARDVQQAMIARQLAFARASTPTKGLRAFIDKNPL